MEDHFSSSFICFCVGFGSKEDGMDCLIGVRGFFSRPKTLHRPVKRQGTRSYFVSLEIA